MSPIVSYFKTRATDSAAVLRGTDKAKSCVVVSSNLRRSISTAVLGFWDRLSDQEEKIVILPCLQEITHNPDAMVITPPYQQPPLSSIERALETPDMQRGYLSMLDMEQHHGGKTVESNGLKRMEEFNKWLFHSNDNEVVVAVGHSLWFKSFFNEYLPRHDESSVKKNKLPNCGMVEFDIECQLVTNEIESRHVYRIEPSSIRVLKE
jgi:hypothetical protein